MEFCKNCGAMLLPNTEVCSNCGQKVTSEEIDKIKEEYKQELDDTELNSKEADVDKGEEINTLPTIKITCPECGYNTAGWWLRQTRSADEAETRFYKCLDCGHTWREYD